MGDPILKFYDTIMVVKHNSEHTVTLSFGYTLSSDSMALP
jgi:hypothetical protein